MRGFRILKLAVFVMVILLLIPEAEPEEGSKGGRYYLIHWNSRYWYVDEGGILVRTAQPEEGSKMVVYGCVDLDGMRVRERYMEKIEKYDEVLEREEVSEVCVGGKRVIFRKGVVVYFHKWEDLIDGMDAIIDQLPVMIPGSVLELFRGGDLLVLKGGWKWRDTRYTHP